MRLAIVSPLPPSPTGIADYTLEVVRCLGNDHAIDLFHDQPDVSATLPAPAFRIEELPGRLASKAYGAVIYQMGNAPAHDFMYEWMEKIPGAVVLHDLVLHHSYARRYLESPDSRAYAADPSSREKREKVEAQHGSYRAAIEAVYPGLGERLKDAQLNSTGDLLPYAFPLFEPALAGALAVGAHNSCMVEAIEAARPDLPCVELAMPVESGEVEPERLAALRIRLGLRDTDLVVGCFGLVTREKRIETVARVVARVAEIHPGVRLLLAGPVADGEGLGSILKRASILDRTVVAGRLDPGDFLAAMALTHAVVHLRYPTARETSAALLRVMAQGRPVVISDIANQSGIPDDVVRRVDPSHEEGDLTRSIDWILRHPKAAQAMGERAAHFARTAHSKANTRETYGRLLNFLAPHYPRPLP
ncbi:MAG: glycosyltransferase [Vicinamibacteria bacterium]|nr:glycosyltransferase [Vicinamibacteria bacterium]